MKFRNILGLMMIPAILFIQSCGSAGGGITTLNTSMVSATVDTLVLDSDVVSWVDSTGAKATACASTSQAATPAADSINMTIVSKTYSNTASTALPVRIGNVTISYSPANTTTPAMASEYQTVGQIIQPGASLTVPVRISSQEQKIRLQSVLSCSATIYNYYVTLTADVTEIGTDKKGTVTTNMQLRFADFVDK